MDAMTGAVALAALRKIRSRDEEWQDEERRAAREGLRPHYCRHGVNMWVEWDCACWKCEQSLTPHEEALEWAHQIVAEVKDRSRRRTDALVAMAAIPIGLLTHETYAALDRWVTEPIDRVVES